MHSKKEYVWYASYGSNLSRERFLSYIRGGQPQGCKKAYEGCGDKTLPIREKTLTLNNELYFAKKSGTWSDGGVAFIGCSPSDDHLTYAKMYLITKEQFSDLVRQETHSKDIVTLDFDRAEKERNYIYKDPSWYGNLLYVTREEEYPVFTFTSKEPFTTNTKPHYTYLKTIARGIMENFRLTSCQIAEYLIDKRGVKGFYNKEELQYVIELQ